MKSLLNQIPLRNPIVAVLAAILTYRITLMPLSSIIQFLNGLSGNSLYSSEITLLLAPPIACFVSCLVALAVTPQYRKAIVTFIGVGSGLFSFIATAGVVSLLMFIDNEPKPDIYWLPMFLHPYCVCYLQDLPIQKAT